MILTVRTDKPDSELGLFDESGNKINYEVWPAHRMLASTIHDKLKEVTGSDEFSEIKAIIYYGGPGSFTGLRIGAALVNALSYSNDFGEVVVTSGIDWIKKGISKLKSGNYDKVALPEYGALPHITKQKK
jgi:tRNA threonylcarbamoyladenosine biosynthesis protein TsaB